MKLACAGLACFLLALALGRTPALAKGPVETTFDLEIAGGGVIPQPGSPVSTLYRIWIDWGTPPEPPFDYFGNPAPSDVGFPDAIYILNSGLTNEPGPGMPGSDQSAAAIGARLGLIDATMHSNAMIYTAASQFIPPNSYFAGAVPNCGDNSSIHTEREYVPNPNPWFNEQTINHTIEYVIAGTMAGRDVIASSLHGAGWTASEYASSGGALVQSFDDDNNNGLLDGLEGGVAEPPTDDDFQAYPDPYTGPSDGSFYFPGTPETQHDTDADGIPDGAESMPDYLPVLVESLGLAPYWVQRGYSIILSIISGNPAMDVHIVGFAGVPGIGSFSMVLIGASPLVPEDPLAWPEEYCTPLFIDIQFDAETSAAELCAWTETCAPPPGVTDTGDAVQTVTGAGPHTGTIVLSDVEDYDNDGLVEPRDICDRDASTNADPDFDILAGVCDPNPLSWDNDGDGDDTFADRAPSIRALHGVGAPLATCQTSGNGICDNDVDDDGRMNNIDNCETTANTEQWDGDRDGVGDVCDAFTVADPLNGRWAGAGNGTNTSENVDNDLLCTESWTPGGTQPLELHATVTCANINDANDDGVEDAADAASDSDGDGASDGAEAAAGTSPLDPSSYPLTCLVPVTDPGDVNDNYFLDSCELLGAGDPSDDDGDGVLDGIEYGAGTARNGSATSYSAATADTDGDGCTNERELNAVPPRHPGNWWDHYDVNGNGNVDLSDTIAVLQKFGLQDQQKDRRRLLNPGPPALLVEANDGVDLTEALASLFQFGWGGCVAPGAVPSQGGGKYD